MRNSVDELFVEGTCYVFGVNVCVVFECYGVVVVVICVLDRVLCSVCSPMVFLCVPSRFLSCLCLCGWRSLYLTPVYWDLVTCLCLSSLCVLFCCIWVVVGVCLCCESCLLVCVSCLLGKVCEFVPVCLPVVSV